MFSSVHRILKKYNSARQHSQPVTSRPPWKHRELGTAALQHYVSLHGVVCTQGKATHITQKENRTKGKTKAKEQSKNKKVMEQPAPEGAVRWLVCVLRHLASRHRTHGSHVTRGGEGTEGGRGRHSQAEHAFLVRVEFHVLNSMRVIFSAGYCTPWIPLPLVYKNRYDGEPLMMKKKKGQDYHNKITPPPKKTKQ